MRKANMLLLSSLALWSAGVLHAQSGADSQAARYPLRLHILAVDDTHKTVHMQPNPCSAYFPDTGGGLTSGGGDPCSNSGGSLSFGGDDDFSGGGRGDLVTPPGSTEAFGFSYEGCSRVRVPPGFQGLPARWKTPEKKIEVLIPTDGPVARDGQVPVAKCTLTLVMHDFVYLRVPSGKMVQISPADYQRKPALRMFLSGGSEALQRRVPPVVSVKELVPTNEPKN